MFWGQNMTFVILWGKGRHTNQTLWNFANASHVWKSCKRFSNIFSCILIDWMHNHAYIFPFGISYRLYKKPSCPILKIYISKIVLSCLEQWASDGSFFWLGNSLLMITIHKAWRTKVYRTFVEMGKSRLSRLLRLESILLTLFRSGNGGNNPPALS